MRDCRDVIMLAKPGYIYIVRNGGKNRSGETGGGKKEAGRKLVGAIVTKGGFCVI